MTVIAVEHVLMPWDNAVANLMPLRPPPLEWRHALVDENPLPVRHPEGFKVSLLHRLPDEGGLLQDLLPANDKAANSLSQVARVVRGVELAVNLQELPYVLKAERRLRVANAPEHLGNLLINNGDLPIGQMGIVQGALS